MHFLSLLHCTTDHVACMVVDVLAWSKSRQIDSGNGTGMGALTLFEWAVPVDKVKWSEMKIWVISWFGSSPWFFFVRSTLASFVLSFFRRMATKGHFICLCPCALFICLHYSAAKQHQTHSTQPNSTQLNPWWTHCEPCFPKDCSTRAQFCRNLKFGQFPKVPFPNQQLVVGILHGVNVCVCGKRRVRTMNKFIHSQQTRALLSFSLPAFQMVCMYSRRSMRRVLLAKQKKMGWSGYHYNGLHQRASIDTNDWSYRWTGSIRRWKVRPHSDTQTPS